jgi:hypothetical protein
MKRIISVLILILILLAVVVILISYPGKDTKYCKINEDCIPSSCCHPTDCMNSGNKPDCKDIMCTMECKPGTMDCGQGHCGCINNECKAIIE